MASNRPRSGSDPLNGALPREPGHIMTRRRVLLVFDEHYASNGHVVFAAVQHLLRQSLGDFEYRVVCRGRYRGPAFGHASKVRVVGHPVAPVGQERRLLDRVRRKLARFRIFEAADRWISNVDAADRPVLRALFDADSLHAVIVFTVDPAYGLAVARLTHVYATTQIPHIVVVTSEATVAPGVVQDLRWLNARILRDGHAVLGRSVVPRRIDEPPVLAKPASFGVAGVTDLLAVAAMFDASLPLAFLDPGLYPSHGLQAYSSVDWRDWIDPSLAYPRRVRDVVLFVRPDWMVCGSGTTFESLARWFRRNDALLIDVGVWPYSVPFEPAEVNEKLIEQQTHLGSALYFSVRESNSVPHILSQIKHLLRWLPSSIVTQVLLFNTRAAKPRLLTQAIRHAKISHIYVNHYFTYLFAEDLIAGRKFFLDTHDIQAVNFVHNGSRNLFTRRGDRFERLLADEMRVAMLAERLCFVSLEEMQLAARFMPQEKLDFIIALPDVKPCRRRPMNRTPRLLVVASNNGANQRNLAWMLDQVLPNLRALVYERVPNMVPVPMPEIHICGSISAALAPSDSPFVKIHGIVPDLCEHYDQADIVLLPVITGGGVAIKTVEALLYERPIVATRHAMRGLPDKIADTVGFENDPGAFARQIVGLLRSQRMREFQTERVRRAAQLLREEGFYDRLSKAMDAVRL
ncbi:MAG: glycosyltransferase [Mycobacterium sp.]|nr:glycosyltransferase [Mycobacterium sp.]